MLFLAVFCGFLAENFREHQVEHKRGKQYLQSLLTDIKEDTAAISKSRLIATRALAYEDSVILFLYKNHPTDFLPEHFLDLDFNAMLRLKVVFNEGTAMQLKNSGSMRLIQKSNVFQSISLYWNEQENTRISLARYLEYRNRGREFAEKLFAFSDHDLIEAKLIDPSPKGIRVIQSNEPLWSEYSNIISHCHITALNYLEQLEKLSNKANELIDLLQKEYHIK
jgi:hypothetical protein